MTQEKFKEACKKFLEHLQQEGISKKQIKDIHFCLKGVENVEYGGINVTYSKMK